MTPCLVGAFSLHGTKGARTQRTPTEAPRSAFREARQAAPGWARAWSVLGGKFAVFSRTVAKATQIVLLVLFYMVSSDAILDNGWHPPSARSFKAVALHSNALCIGAIALSLPSRRTRSAGCLALFEAMRACLQRNIPRRSTKQKRHGTGVMEFEATLAG